MSCLLTFDEQSTIDIHQVEHCPIPVLAPYLDKLVKAGACRANLGAPWELEEEDDTGKDARTHTA